MALSTVSERSECLEYSVVSKRTIGDTSRKNNNSLCKTLKEREDSIRKKS